MELIMSEETPWQWIVRKVTGDSPLRSKLFKTNNLPTAYWYNGRIQYSTRSDVYIITKYNTYINSIQITFIFWILEAQYLQCNYFYYW